MESKAVTFSPPPSIIRSIENNSIKACLHFYSARNACVCVCGSGTPLPFHLSEEGSVLIMAVSEIIIIIMKAFHESRQRRLQMLFFSNLATQLAAPPAAVTISSLQRGLTDDTCRH